MNPVSVCPGKWSKILACTDGSPEGQNAVFQALELARACSCKVHTVQVVEIIPEFEAVAPDLRSCLEEEIRAATAALKQQAADLEVNIEHHVLNCQSPHRAIVAEAEQAKTDLIVIGRSGHTGLTRLFMGNVTAGVIGHSPVDVLVVPQGMTLDFARLLIAADGSAYSAAAWETALAMAKRAGSKLLGICAAREEGEIIEAKAIIHQMLEAANQEGVAFTGLSPQGQQPDDAIIQTAIKEGVNLIIMGSHGRTGLQKLLMGSVTERVIGDTPCPVLVVKKK
jgi:nucleotide-binding universal stress UspA family protein